jgi:hypothetical protein
VVMNRGGKVSDCAMHNADFEEAHAFDFPQLQSSGSILVLSGIQTGSLESLQKPAFPFASIGALK